MTRKSSKSLKTETKTQAAPEPSTPDSTVSEVDDTQNTAPQKPQVSWASSSETNINYNPVIEYLKDEFPNLLAKVGFVVSIIIYTLNPTNFNLIIVLIYVLTFLLNFLLIHKKGFGIVYDKKTKSVLPNAQVSVISATLGNTLGVTQTDERGRYYVLLPFGDYQITTKVTAGDKTVQSDEVKKINKNHCVVDFDIAV